MNRLMRAGAAVAVAGSARAPSASVAMTTNRFIRLLPERNVDPVGARPGFFIKRLPLLVTGFAPASSSGPYGYPAAGARIEVECEPSCRGVPLRAGKARSAGNRRRQRQRRPPDHDGLIRVTGVHAHGEGPVDAVAAPGMDTAGRGDDIGTGQVPERIHVRDLPAPIDDPPPPVLPPLPPGPPDPQIVRLIEGRVSVGVRPLLCQVVAELADPERRRHLGRLFDALLKSLPQKVRVARPERRDEAGLVMLGSVT